MREVKECGIEWTCTIPSHWKVLKNKYLMHKEKNIVPTYNGEDILSLTMNGVIVRDLENPSGKMPATFDGYQRLSPGNLLMCLFDIDVTPRCVGKIMNEGLTSPAYSQFILHDIADQNYYYYYYLALDNSKELLHLAKNLRHSFTEDQFGSIDAPVPPKVEQKKIADVLDKKCAQVETLIANQEAQIEKLKAYKQSMITEVVTKGLKPNVSMKNSGMEWVASIPEHWETVQLSSVVSERKHKNTGMIEDNLLSLSYGYIKRKDIKTSDGLLPESFEGYNIVEKGDIVLRLTDLQNDHTSLRTGLCSERGIITSAYVTLQNKSDVIISEYLHYVLHAFDICKGFYGMGAGVRQGLNYDGVKKVIVLKPSLSEQKEICEYIAKKEGQIEKLIAIKQQKIEKLNQYKKSLIYEYVTGKKEV